MRHKKHLSDRQIKYARTWLENCTSPNFDLSDDQVEAAINKHYFGGVSAFVAESSGL